MTIVLGMCVKIKMSQESLGPGTIYAELLSPDPPRSARHPSGHRTSMMYDLTRNYAPAEPPPGLLYIEKRTWP